MSTKFVILPAGGLPPAWTLSTNFVLSLVSGLDALYIYIIYIYIYIYIYLPINCKAAVTGEGEDTKQT